SRRRHTRFSRDWSSDVCSSDLGGFRLQQPGGVHATRAARAHLSALLGVFVLLKAAAYWLDRYGLAFSERGFVHGPSYTDVNAVRSEERRVGKEGTPRWSPANCR